VLQGGGALGAYQAGVYQALHECGIEPDWVSGVSIGAINAAIIAGNVPDQRLSRLRTFWELITDRKIWPFTPDGDVFRKARNATSSWMTMLGGQPGFFEPRVPSPWLSFTVARTATSYYDNGPLRETLQQLVDFSIIKQAIRFAVGAVNVTGNSLFRQRHANRSNPSTSWRAEAAPGLPMMKTGIDHRDGGRSNTCCSIADS
jgi:NTE family protein